MKFDVVIQTALPVQSGTSKSGKAWSRQTYVGTYDGSNPQYPKQIVFDVLGDKIGQMNLQPGMRYEVEVDFAAREWQGRWYMSANCWNATAYQQAPPQQYAQPMPGGYPPQQYPPQQYPQQGAGAFYGQQTAYPVNPQSATPTLDAMGVQGYQQPAQSAPTQNGDDDLPF